MKYTFKNYTVKKQLQENVQYLESVDFPVALFVEWYQEVGRYLSKEELQKNIDELVLEGPWGRRIGNVLGGIGGGFLGNVAAPGVGTVAGTLAGAGWGGRMGDAIGNHVSNAYSSAKNWLGNKVAGGIRNAVNWANNKAAPAGGTGPAPAVPPAAPQQQPPAAPQAGGDPVDALKSSLPAAVTGDQGVAQALEALKKAIAAVQGSHGSAGI